MLLIFCGGIFWGTTTVWIVRSGTGGKEDLLIVVQDEVINLLLYSLNRETIDIISQSWNWLNWDGLFNFLLDLLRLWFEEASLEGLEWVKEAFLSGKSLVILKHLLWAVLGHLPQSVDIHLHLIFIVLESTKHSERWADDNILLSEPSLEIVLPFPSTAHHAGPVIIQPEDTSHYTCGIIDAKKEAVLLSDLEDDGACDCHFSQQEVVS